MSRILIVANQTAGGAHLHEEVARRAQQGGHSFTLLVPATAPRHGMTWTEGEARALAKERMDHAIEALSDLGVEIDGVVGEARPMDAIADLMLSQRFDEIIISTLPPRLSRWLRMDLPRRAERAFGIPVTHVVGEAERTKKGRGAA